MMGTGCSNQLTRLFPAKLSTKSGRYLTYRILKSSTISAPGIQIALFRHSQQRFAIAFCHAGSPSRIFSIGVWENSAFWLLHRSQIFSGCVHSEGRNGVV